MTQRGKAQEPSQDYEDVLPTPRTRYYFHEDRYPSQDPVGSGDRNAGRYYDTAANSGPATPRKPAAESQYSPATTTPRRGSPNNFRMSVEVPLEIAQSSQISWTMSPLGTPTRAADTARGPEGSPVRRQRVSTRLFGTTPLSQESSTSDVFGPAMPPAEQRRPRGSETGFPEPPTPPPEQRRSRALSTPPTEQRRSHTLSPPQTPYCSPPSSPSPVAEPRSLLHRTSHRVDVLPVSPTPVIQASSSAAHISSPNVHRAIHRPTGTIEQEIQLPIFDNQISEFDPTWATPVYPLQRNQAAETSLPNIAVHPRRYYLITKGLRIGVFYDKWDNVKPLCRNLKGGIGYCRKMDTLRLAIIEYKKSTDKVLIPNIGHC